MIHYLRIIEEYFEGLPQLLYPYDGPEDEELSKELKQQRTMMLIMIAIFAALFIVASQYA